MSRRNFYKNYVLEVDKEFEFEGVKATWAPSTSGNPLCWGEEQSSIDLTSHVGRTGFIPSCSLALSPDGLLLAVLIDKSILVYSTESNELRAKLTAAERTMNQLRFLPMPAKDDDCTYVLFSTAQNHRPSLHDEEYSTVVRWSLSKHGLPTAEDGQTIVRGRWAGWDSVIWNHDATRFYAIAHNEPTQQGMREPDLLPQIVVFTFSLSDHEGKPQEVSRLKGHRDAIMWASWSPNVETANTIVSAAWDGTYRVWDAQTGVCRHKIDIPSGDLSSEDRKWPVQNWSGSFSPDGKYVMLSGTNNYAVYETESAAKVVELVGRDGIKLAHWVRRIAWNPNGPSGMIAVANDCQLLLWRPLEQNAEGQHQDKLDVLLEIKDGKGKLAGFQEFYRVKWLDKAGQLLAVVDSAGNHFVWHRTKGWKWRFQRPTEDIDVEALDLLAFDIVYNETAGVFYTLDLDKKVRVWPF